MIHIGNLAWDSFDVYLFDIDGTLIHCTDATHYFAFCEALQHLSGRDLTLEGVVAHGNTDLGILRDALALANVPESRWRPQLSGVCSRMCDFVEERKHQLCASVLPSAREVLAHLRFRGAKLGVATGNLQRIGTVKLERADLLEFFDFGGWSDGFETRTEVFRAAVSKARMLYGPFASICVLGDTPADVRAAHDVVLPVIAVATGVFPYEELMQEQPEACLNSFAELLSSSEDR